MGKLTDDQQVMVDGILNDTSLTKQQQADQLTAVYRTFGPPYDRVVFSTNGDRFRVVLNKRRGERG